MNFVQPLLSEIDRQLVIQPSNSNTSSELRSSPIINISDEIYHHNYRNDLTILRQVIAGFEAPDAEALRDLSVRPENLIWQIPAFRNNGIIIDQDYAKERTSALLELRSKDKNITDDIWNDKEVTDWSSCTGSRILITTGTSQCHERLEKFSVELVEHLTSNSVELLTTNRHTTLYLLSPLPREVYDSSDPIKQGCDILRHLAVQSLRTSRPSKNPYNIGFLTEILLGFKSSKISDWFITLKRILAYHSYVNIVINLRVLGNHFQDARHWPIFFLKVINELRGITVLKVMLISGRPMSLAVDPAIRTMSVFDGGKRLAPRKDTLHLQRPSCRGRYSRSIDRSSNVHKLHQDGKGLERSSLSPPPNPPSGIESNLQTSSSILSDLTTNRVENLDDCNLPDIVDQDHNASKAVQGKDTCGLTRNMEGLNFGVLQSAGSEANEGSAQQWFKKLETTTHQVIYGQNSPSSTPVKVAVLDTGFAYTNPEDKRLLKPYYQRIKKFVNFIDGDIDLDAKKDTSGHGTAVAIQILKVSLRAVLYICRVANLDGTNTTLDISAVERAIRKAAAKPDKDRPDGGGWGVDIINMSFGWSYQHEGVRQAIDFARQNGVHLFASTSNDGLLGPPNDILYPARSDDVIAIDAADGFGEHARTAPSLSSQYSRGSRFSAPGLGLSCPNSATKWSGSSFACPIAAGIGALLLEFTRQPPLGEGQSVHKCLQDMPAMLALFRRMSSEKETDGLKFLTPWKLTGESSEERLFVSMDIVKELRKEYGPEVGNEVSWGFYRSLK